MSAFDTQNKMQIGTVLLTALVLAELVLATNVVIDYNSKDLPVVPAPNITSDATHIRLKNNPFGSIPNGTFAGLRLTTALYEINLENTGLSDDTVTRDSFVGLEYVRVVSQIDHTFPCQVKQENC